MAVFLFFLLKKGNSLELSYIDEIKFFSGFKFFIMLYIWGRFMAMDEIGEVF